MIRNGRTPTLLLVGLICIILIISYNYWILSQKHVSLNEALIIKEEKLNDLMEKNANVEKQSMTNAERIKYFEERIEANSQALKQKDTEIDDLNSRLTKKTQENDKILLELNELRDDSNNCKADKEKIEESNKKELSKLQEEITKLKERNCSTAQADTNLDQFKDGLFNLLNSKLGEDNSKKLQLLLKNENNNLDLNLLKQLQPLKPQENNNNNNSAIQVNQIPDLNLNENVCKLPKAIGDCQNSTDRFYYDSNSERCLTFSYSGCNGNSNNFKSLEECNSKCSKVSNELPKENVQNDLPQKNLQIGQDLNAKKDENNDKPVELN